MCGALPPTLTGHVALSGSTAIVDNSDVQNSKVLPRTQRTTVRPRVRKETYLLSCLAAMVANIILCTGILVLSMFLLIGRENH